MTIIENVILNSTNTEKYSSIEKRFGTKAKIFFRKIIGMLTGTKGAKKKKRCTEGKNPV